MWKTGYYGYLSDYLWWWVVLASLLIHTWCLFRFFPKQRRPKTFLILGNVLITLCALTFVGLLAESYLRFVSTSTDALGATLTCKRWHAAYTRTNDLGFRDVEWAPEKPAGVRRIAFVGDSFTYGWGINNPENRFADIIQRRFDEKAPGAIEVMNVAWNDWDTQAQRQWTPRVVSEYDVDEIVLCYLPNDIEKILSPVSDVDLAKPRKSTYIRTDGSFLLDYFFYRIYACWSPKPINYFDWIADGYASDTIGQRHTDDLSAIIRYAREHGITLRVALLPFIQTSGQRFDAERIHKQLRAFFEAHEIPVVDLLPVVAGKNPKTLQVNNHDPHPNELANQLFAEAIWNAFYTGSGLADRPDPLPDAPLSPSPSGN